MPCLTDDVTEVTCCPIPGTGPDVSKSGPEADLVGDRRMPLDETTISDDDASVPDFTEIWSSIGPGGHHSVADDGGPPTIRPDDHVIRPAPHRSLSPSPLPTEKVESPVTESANPRNPSTPASEEVVSRGLRDELRVGVRMIKALDAQLKQAETSIRRHEEAIRRAEEVRIDPAEVERTTNEALRRINDLTERIIVDLEARIARQAEMDTRLDELDAALTTLERRVDRMDADPQSMRSASKNLTSGSLAVDDQEPSVSSGNLRGSDFEGLVKRGDDLRRELRTDLEAICSASASLAEIVDRANQTESILRSTIETTTEDRSSSTGDDQRIATLLRRLADEIDRTSTISPEVRPGPRRVAGIDLPRPVVLDLGSGESVSDDSIESPASSAPTTS